MTALEIIDHLLICSDQGENNPHFMLMLSPTASVADVTKQYRQMSVLIHPDKCKEEGAVEAFQLLGQAYSVVNPWKF